jgi:predicted esterase
MSSLSPSHASDSSNSNSTSTSHVDSLTAQLPAILCLHGGGSNTTVYKIQTRRLYWRLSSRFRFVFVQAPIEGPPGGGILPVFASVAPFYRWVSRRFQLGESTVEITSADEVAALDELLLRTMDENGGREGFAGVMGFSQGARLTAGLLLRQQLELETYGSSQWGFRFGVMIGGPFPPIALTPNVTEMEYPVISQVPTVHAWGREDSVKEGARQLADVCDGPKTCVMDFDGGHHLPLKDDEAAELCGLIIDAWRAGGGKDLKPSPSNVLER